MPFAKTTAEVVVAGVAVSEGTADLAFTVAAGVVEWPLPATALLGALFAEHALRPAVASKARLKSSPWLLILSIAPPAEKTGHLVA
jgi:hypothetical protein